MATNNNLSLDALIPAEMAAKAEAVGVSKARLGKRRMFLLAVLAGSFIGLGAIFATTVAAGSGGIMPYGLTRLLVGIVFSLGLILVIVGGAELFTGNNLIVMAWANQKITTGRLLRNWIVVYLGNFVGSILTAGLLFLSGQYQNGGGAVGASALATANAKAGLGFVEALVLGILCNALVCLAVWLTFSARTTTDKIMAIIPPIAAFVAAGFEHSVANMYFIPVGLLIKSGASPEFWASIGKTAADYPDLTWMNFFITNLVPVTIGNIIGGTLFVGGVYWFLFLRTPRNP
ncbi:MAG: formate transporter FocA [Chloroflexi bacterium]|nr:MAG: formate transporter FocA [Chloroflexota bacterium]MBL1194797.1 formate transporter FocA [Chloroflexota bacterium]NOH12089.1 formate transporter FocA [Chloroflexota bacterium]